MIYRRSSTRLVFGIPRKFLENKLAAVDTPRKRTKNQSLLHQKNPSWLNSAWNPINEHSTDGPLNWLK